jgi:TonB family protein
MARSGKPAGTIFYILGANRSELVAAGPNPELTMRRVQGPGDIIVSGLGAALALVDSCSADLLEKWGYSKEFQRQLATAPKPKEAWPSYVSPYDFPQTALAAVKGGETNVLVDVDVDGHASNCRVISSSGRQDIDRTTCVIVAERAKYQPALDIKGEPIASPYYATFRWEIPGL